MEEVEERIAQGKLGKSPGPDGLPVKYCQSHSYDMFPFLTAYYNAAIHSMGHLPPSMRENQDLKLQHKFATVCESRGGQKQLPPRSREKAKPGSSPLTFWTNTS